MSQPASSADDVPTAREMRDAWTRAMTAIPRAGRVIVIAPVRSKRDVESFEQAEAKMHAKFAGAFTRLAE